MLDYNLLLCYNSNTVFYTYEISAATSDLVDDYYVQNVTEDIVISEINANELVEYAVTLNGKELTKNVDYTVVASGGNGQWMKYTYTVNKDLFANEGEHNLVVSSKDMAENDAFSDVKDTAINFVVDRTAPVVAVTGMATDGRYQTDVQTVTVIPTDDGGALKSIIISMLDKDGKTIKEIANLAGDELANVLENSDGKIEFTIDNGLYQNVRIVCNDYAVDSNDETNTYDETFTNISVSSSAVMIFWANKPLRWGSIAGVSATAILLAVVIIFVKKKRKGAK